MADSASREASEQAVTTGHEVVVEPLTSPVSQTVALPDGTMQYQVSSVPQRVKQGDAWVGINTDLVAGPEWLEPKASASPVRFSLGGSDVLSQAQTPSGEWITETWPNGALPTPTIDGATATYPEVLPDVDLKLTATDLGMASVYVVKTEKAALSSHLRDLHVDIDGAEITKNKSGTFTADAGGGAPIVASSPLWWDSSNGGTDVQPGGDDPMLPVTHTLTRDGISMDVPATLKSDDVTYPLFIDPDWSSGINASWYTDAAYPNQSYLSAAQSDVLRVGVSDTFKSNMFFQFPISALRGKQIRGAQLGTTQLQSLWCPSSPIEVHVYGPQGAGFTWSQTNGGWGPTLQTQSPGDCHSPAMSVGWDVGAGVQSQAGADIIQFGFTYPAGSTHSRRHFSRDATLYVSYNTPPDAPTNPTFVTPSRGCGTASSPAYISATSVVVSVNQTDADAGNVDTNFYLHKTSDLTNAVQARAPGLGAQGRKSVTFTDLVDGQAYAWRARGSDWIIDGSGYSDWCYFTIDRTGPAAPIVTLSKDQPTVGELVTATFTTAPSDHVTFIAYTETPAATADGFVFDVFGAPPTCNGSYGFVRIACPDATGKASATFAPTDTKSVLLTVSYDLAGNPSLPSGSPSSAAGTVGTKSPVTAGNSPAASFTQGHAWMTQTQSSPLPFTVPDTNLGSPIGLNLGSGVDRSATANPFEPAVPLPNPVIALRGGGPIATVEISRESHYFLAQAMPDADAIPMYSCVPRNGNDFARAASTTAVGPADVCSVASSRTLIGYAWKKAFGELQQIYKCVITNVSNPTIYMGLNGNCSNGGSRGSLVGYASPIKQVTTASAPPQTTGPVLDEGNSFTVAEWVKTGSATSPTLLSTTADGGFVRLSATSSTWSFCVGLTCAYAARQNDGGWTHLAGEMDAVNGVVRLYVNSSLAAAVRLSSPSASNNKAVSVGSSTDTSQFADPATFAGILTASQIGALRAGQDPANG